MLTLGFKMSNTYLNSKAQVTRVPSATHEHVWVPDSAIICLLISDREFLFIFVSTNMCKITKNLVPGSQDTFSLNYEAQSFNDA